MSMPPKKGSAQSEASRPESNGSNVAAPKSADGDLTDSLAKFGIVAVPSMRFEWGGYQYTNATDAIAAAKRAALK
jgi:hypothetical protein